MDVKRGRKPGTPNTTDHNERIRQSRTGKVVVNDGLRSFMLTYSEARRLVLTPDSGVSMGSLKSKARKEEPKEDQPVQSVQSSYRPIFI
jgi:hypothetical protein